MITRKEFLLTIPAVALAPTAFAETEIKPATTPAPTKKPEPTPLTLPPIQPGPPYLQAGPQLGHVAHDHALLWVRATATAPWKVVVTEAANPNAPREFTGPELGVASGYSGIVKLDGLKPGTRYHYEVFLGDRPQTPRPSPSFSTAPTPDQPIKLRIALGSCVGDTLAGAAPAWAELAARQTMKPEQGAFDLLLMLGDNHYANTTEIEKLRVYYTAHRLTGGWRELAAQSPIYAIWDDHDYGPNDSDSTQKGKEDSLRIFKEYWANPACGESENPGCYYTFMRGDVQFFMLDCRYHRSPNKAPDGPEKTMLGAKQLEWLKRELSSSKARIKILATGSEWETFSQQDSWASFRTERDAFFAWIAEHQIEGIILLSGDRHFSAAYHVVGKFVELSGGPFGSNNATLKPNPERFTGWDEGRLWFVLDLDTTKTNPAVAVELWQAGGGRLDRRVLTWDQVNGRAPIASSPFPLKPARMEVKATKPS
ncbi:MAG TPA: alkaline phosphatase D family protein [Chthoniobacteraceae bacterium]|nr:alkaline phosphatase D family protein [Chthoniobacteraceae bacterium]